MSNQLVISSGAKVRNLSGVLTGTAGVVNSLGINVPSGIPQLDGSGKILVSQLPNSVMEYKGTWNAATNTPTLVNGTGNQGDVYLCNVAGTVNFGAGPITFSVGDQVIYSGTIWQRASGATGTVTSVAVTESGDALTITGSPITTSGTINIGFAGTSGQYVNGAGGLTTFPSLTGYVPYTGATGNVNLGEFGLTSGYLGLDITPTSTPTAQGTMYWNADKESVDVIMNGVTGSVMQDTFFNVKNQTGASIPKGTVVRANGTLGASGRILIAPFLADGTYDSKVCLGVTAETIADGEDGKVTAFGAIRQIDTSAFPNGTILYASPSVAGAFTSTEPTNPNNIVTVAIVIYSDNTNGEVFVRPTFVDNATDIASALGYTPANAATYVPYTGATENVDLGFNTLTAYNVQAKGLIATLNGTTSTAISLKTGSTGVQIESDAISLVSSASSSKTLSMYFDIGGVSTKADLNANSLTATRTYTLPDASGTIALTSQLTGGTVTSVGLSSSTSGVTIGSSPITTSGTITLSIATASGLQQGLLSSSDWTTFSSKQAALSGTGFVKISGSTISYDNSTYLTTSSAASTYLPLSGGTLSGALTIGVAAGTGLDVASDLVIFRGNSGIGTPRQIAFSSGGGPTTYIEAKGYGANYNTDLSLRTYNSSGTAFEVFFATSAGDVGIGTTGPLSKLQVVGTGTVMRLGEASGTTGKQLLFGVDGANGRSEIQSVWQGTSNTPLALNPAGGNVLIGTTGDGGSRLQVNGNITAVSTTTSAPANGTGLYLGWGASASNFNGINFQGAFATDMYFGRAVSSDDLVIRSSAGEKVRFTSGGNVGIGTSSPGGTLGILVGGVAEFIINQSGTGDNYYTSGTSGNQIFRTGTTERMRITSGGTLLVGTTSTSNTERFNVTQSGVNWAMAINHTFSTQFFIDFRNNGTGTGSIIATGGVTSYNVTSDYRLKHDLKDYNGLELISKIKTYDFEFKSSKLRMYGLIAHELAEVIPYAVFGEKDAIEMQQVDYSKLTPVNTKAIQELYALVQEQQAQIEELKALINK